MHRGPFELIAAAFFFSGLLPFCPILQPPNSAGSWTNFTRPVRVSFQAIGGLARTESITFSGKMAQCGAKLFKTRIDD
jgi:hypothetical protein